MRRGVRSYKVSVPVVRFAEIVLPVSENTFFWNGRQNSRKGTLSFVESDS